MYRIVSYRIVFCGATLPVQRHCYLCADDSARQAPDPEPNQKCHPDLFMLRVLLYENTGGVESAFRVVFVRSCVLFMLFICCLCCFCCFCCLCNKLARQDPLATAPNVIMSEGVSTLAVV